MQSAVETEAGITGLVAELRDIVSRMVLGRDYGRRVQWPPSELAGVLALKKELQEILKAAQSAVSEAEAELLKFTEEHGIDTTPTEQEAA